MKYIKSSFIIFAMFGFFCSCKKETHAIFSNSSLTIVNASADNPIVTATFSDTVVPFYISQAIVYVQSFLEFGRPSGNVPLILVSSADTSNSLFHGNFNLQAGGIYSFYIASNGKTLDTMFMQDHIVNYSDSLAGVRFVNLATGSAPISINLAGNPSSQTEFPNLAYKQISEFKTYPDTSGILSYIFEIHDQASGNLLTTFEWNFTVFKNQTLVVSGSADPSGVTPINVFAVNNF